MSVYTSVTAEELEAWLLRYSIGNLIDLQPIASGIENTNYFVDTRSGRYVLTLYERMPAEELPFYLNLMAHLARANVACPAPIADRTGAYFSHLNGKPAGLVTRVAGAPVEEPDCAHCAKLGEALGRLHAASATYRPRLTNRRGPTWWRQAARAVRPFLDTSQHELLDAELEFQTPFGNGVLPQAAIHGDLFCDNVLFSDGRVTGIIDFGFAATDYLAYDLAIAVNDWCVEKGGVEQGALVPDLAVAMLEAYDNVRPLTRGEREEWPTLLRAAALRFWVSRLYDLHLPRPGELTHAHDPTEFERILRQRVAHPPSFPLRGQAAGALR